MRTTLDIDADVLQAAKELAVYEKSTAGKIISKLFRRGLRAPDVAPSKEEFVFKNGIPVLPSRGGELITLEHVRKLMEEEDL